ncbi:MAG: type VI secretion system baseplate subunit TssF, partial [Minicystis sp.]
MATTGNDLRSLLAKELSALTGDARLRSGLPLPPEDPDLARIIEALAFFSAKTRAVAESSTYSAVKRIAGASLDDLLCPMPAMTLLQAVPDERILKAVRLPQGTPVRLAAPESRMLNPRLLLAAPAHEAMDEHVALFTTTAPLEILPVKVVRAGITIPPDGKRRLEIRLKARGKLVPPPR